MKKKNYKRDKLYLTISLYILSILLIKKLTKPPFWDKTRDKKAIFRFLVWLLFFIYEETCWQNYN